jgi:hypothetical protein
LKENVEDISVGKALITDRYWLRMNSNETRDPQQGAVLAVGDSFTGGSGIDSAQTWPAELEKRLSVPVLNAAADAWGAGTRPLRDSQENLAVRSDTLQNTWIDEGAVLGHPSAAAEALTAELIKEHFFDNMTSPSNGAATSGHR